MKLFWRSGHSFDKILTRCESACRGPHVSCELLTRVASARRTGSGRRPRFIFAFDPGFIFVPRSGTVAGVAVPASIPMSARVRSLANAALVRPGSPFVELPERFILVDADRQRLLLLESGEVQAEYPVSTAAAGIGGEDGSLRTPPGWHRIDARIGEGAPSGAIFKSRERTGEIWRGAPEADDLILTRVLTLDGLEEGVNHGPGHDSRERYIYIHGTNHERELGQPASHGCVRMANADVIDLFERVAEGDPVVIVAKEPAPVA
jgi:lipoprotein-anchoring transpeptidase ErfK/SrfK